MIRFLAVSFCLIMTGCADFRDYTPPTPPEGLTETDFINGEEKRFKAAEPIKKWWTQLEDETLNTLILEGIKNNHDLQIALTNVLEARAVTRETKFDRFPTVQAFFDYRRQQLTEEGVTFALPDRTFNSFSSGLEMNWELDLLGRVEHRIELTKALNEARLADLQSAYVAVTAEIASAYIDLRGAQLRLEIASRNAKNQQKTFNITKTLSDAGSASELDVARARSQLESTLATIPPLETKKSTAIYRLSVLTGQVPKALEENLSHHEPLPSLPESFGVGNPEELLRRRPDIRSAERELAASVAQYNLSVVDLFPKIDILGSISFDSTELSDFGQGSAIGYSVGPTIRWAAFDLGRVYARIDQNDAASYKALKQYEQTVLIALEEVQNSLKSFSSEERRLFHLRNSAEQSAKAARLARQRFEAGLDDFIDVLDAERTLLETQDASAVSEIQTAQNMVDIYQSLGGGWQILEAPQEHKNNGKWKGLKISVPSQNTD